MHYINEQLPLPYLKIDKEGNIVSCSAQTWQMFDLRSEKLADIIDEESRSKLYKFGFQQKGPKSMEVHMQTAQHDLHLFELHICWDENDYGHILLVEKSLANEKVAQKLMDLQRRLAATDFELFEKKEQLAQALSRLHELSAPFIPISGEVCYIPIFGDITEEKVNVLSENSLHNMFSGSYNIVLIDFTAVGELERAGVEKLSILLKMMHFMTGAVISIIGVTPAMARLLNSYPLDEYVQFESSLQAVLYQCFNRK